MSLSQEQIDKLTIPSLEARLTSDTYNIHQMVGMMQRLGIRAPILLIGGIFVTLTLEPVLTLILVSILPFIGILVWRVSKKGIPLYNNLQKSIDRLIGTVRENISGVRVIKALSKTDYEKVRFDRANSEVSDSEKKAGTVMALTNPVMNLLLNAGLTLVILVGAYRVNAGISGSGKIIAFLSYFIIILNAMLSITRIFVVYSKGSASAARLQEVLDMPVDLAVSESDFSLKNAGNKGTHIQFENVDFSYLKQKNNLENINFCLGHGETLGIIGTCGSGKSTVINLLMRLYDVDKGEIQIDGVNIKEIPGERLHRMFGVVFQKDILTADSIYENIDFGRGLTLEQVTAAARTAQAEEFINNLDEKYNHKLTSKGTNLSGGQKQRLLIARAIAGNPQILILDDSSSALDYKTDMLMRNALYENYKDTTKIIIAQRVNSIMNSEKILVLDDGVVMGYGMHEELLASCAMYKEIFDIQMGGGEIA